MSLPTCPKCGSQLEVKLMFASGPKSATPAEADGDIGWLLGQAEGRYLNKWEEEFISKLRERYDQYGKRTKLSDKQRDILDKIAAGE